MSTRIQMRVLLCLLALAVFHGPAAAQAPTYCVYLIKGTGFSSLGLSDGDKICVDCPGDGKCPGSAVNCTLTIQDAEGHSATGSAGRFDASCLTCPADGKPGFRFVSSDCPVPTIPSTWGSLKVIYR